MATNNYIGEIIGGFFKAFEKIVRLWKALEKNIIVLVELVYIALVVWDSRSAVGWLNFGLEPWTEVWMQNQKFGLNVALNLDRGNDRFLINIRSEFILEDADGALDKSSNKWFCRYTRLCKDVITRDSS